MRSTTMLTWRGHSLDVISPEPYAIDPKDIAHALSLICRFGGHIPRHYSVAQHSIYVGQIASALVASQPTQVAATMYLEGLIHDAAEAYVGDMISPVKGECPGFREIERRFEVAIRLRFDLPAAPSAAVRAVVKSADAVALAMEDHFLRGFPLDPSSMAGILKPQRIEPWDAELAERRLLVELRGALGENFHQPRRQHVTA